MSYDFISLIKTEEVKEKIINLHKVGYENGVYFFVISWGNYGLFEEKKFDDKKEADNFFNSVLIKLKEYK